MSAQNQGLKDFDYNEVMTKWQKSSLGLQVCGCVGTLVCPM